MIPMLSPAPSDADMKAVRSSAQGVRSGGGDAFEGAIRTASEQGGKGRDGERGSTHDDTADAQVPARAATATRRDGLAPGSGDAVPRSNDDEANTDRDRDGGGEDAPTQRLGDAGDVLSLLSLPRAAPHAPDGEDGSSATHERAFGSGAAEADRSADDLGPADRTRLKLAVLRMETHFEPTVQTPVLVEAGPRGADAVADVPPGFETLLDGLSDPSASTAAIRTTATAAAATRTREAGRDEAIVLDGAIDRASREAGGAAADAGADAADRLVGHEPRRRADERPVPRRGFEETRVVATSVARDIERAAAATSLAVPAATLGDRALPSMALQVAATVVDALPQPVPAGAGGASRPAGEAELRMRAGGAALKTITIQLQPEHLGVLDVSMRLVDGRLSLELAADKADTAQLLLDDRGGLKSLLEKAGFTLDDASITVVARDYTVNPSTRSDQVPDDRANRDGPARGDGGDPRNGGGERASPQERREDRSTRGTPVSATRPRSAGGGVFL